MQYFSVELCKKLQEKGLQASFWYYLHPESDSEFIEVAGFISDDGCSTPDYPLFIFQDLLTKDNAIKLWGVEEVDDYFGFTKNEFMNDFHGGWMGVVKVKNYQYKSLLLVEIYQQSGIEAVEEHLNLMEHL